MVQNHGPTTGVSTKEDTAIHGSPNMAGVGKRAKRVLDEVSDGCVQTLVRHPFVDNARYLSIFWFILGPLSCAVTTACRGR